MNIFFKKIPSEVDALGVCGRRLRVTLRLTNRDSALEFHGSPLYAIYHIDVEIVTVHHFEETINGQHYAFEVTPAHGARWRAYLVSTTGGPTALMPFYGGTPQEAVANLVAWLSLAHRVAMDSV